MSKPKLVTWPFVMLLLDYWPLRRFEPVIQQQHDERPRHQHRLAHQTQGKQKQGQKIEDRPGTPVSGFWHSLSALCFLP